MTMLSLCSRDAQYEQCETNKTYALQLFRYGSEERQKDTRFETMKDRCNVIM
jgi:hypothetical protein